MQLLIVDAHQDLAYNIKTFGRDYSLSALETRAREQGSEIPSRNGDTLLGWPEYQRGRVGVIFATLFAGPVRCALGDWDTQTYKTYEQAHELYRAQVDAYYRLVDQHPDRFRLIHSQKDLQAVVWPWLEQDSRSVEGPPSAAETKPDADMDRTQADLQPLPVGLVLLMEGAEGIRHPGELAEWWQLGVRIIGPAWTGTRYCGGTREPGPMTKEGFELLEAMAEIGFVLDVSHMDEPAVLQALEAYPGTIIASHSNAAALLKGVDTNRHLSERVSAGLLERDAVIGTVIHNAFLKPGWKMANGRQGVTLQDVVAQIDYICQSAGDSLHAGLGTDFDGGYGWQSVPEEIDTIADLVKLAPLLAEKGYQEQDIEAIFGRNWLDRLNGVLPEDV
jgi:membrane dipeptidase